MQRCTRRTLQYKGGQVDFATHSVWIMRDGAIVRLTNALALNKIGDEVVIVVTEGERPGASDFTSLQPLPSGISRHVTSAAHALGRGHLDRPVTPDDRQERGRYVERQLNRLYGATGGSQKNRETRTAPLRTKFIDLAERVGTDRLTREIDTLIRGGHVDNLASAMRALEQLPTLADLAGAPVAYGPPRPVGGTGRHPLLDKLPTTAGTKLGVRLAIDLSIDGSVTTHAICRWLERVDRDIDRPLVGTLRDIISARRPTRETELALRGRLLAAFDERNLHNRRVKEVRAAIAALVTADGDAAPVVGGRTVGRYNVVQDRFIVDVPYGDRTLELTLGVRGDKATTDSNGTPVIAVSVLTVLDHGYDDPDVWADDQALPPVQQKMWADQLQKTLLNAMLRYEPVEPVLEAS